jgi:hypothetical protein
MNLLTLERMVPSISARASCVTVGISVCGSPESTDWAISKSVYTRGFSLLFKS